MDMYGLDTSILNQILGLDDNDDIPEAAEVMENYKDEIEVVEDEDSEESHKFEMDVNLRPEDLDDYDENETENELYDDENESELDDENESELYDDENESEL